MAIYALVRVSSKNQNEARQVKEMIKNGVPRDNIIIEKQSGKNFNRKKYNALIKLLKKGDVLFIQNIDRLGRNYEGILDHWNRLTKEKEIIYLFRNLMDYGKLSLGDGNEQIGGIGRTE